MQITLKSSLKISSILFQQLLFKNASEALGSCMFLGLGSDSYAQFWIRFLSCFINLWSNFSNVSWMKYIQALCGAFLLVKRTTLFTPSSSIKRLFHFLKFSLRLAMLAGSCAYRSKDITYRIKIQNIFQNFPVYTLTNISHFIYFIYSCSLLL